MSPTFWAALVAPFLFIAAVVSGAVAFFTSSWARRRGVRAWQIFLVSMALLGPSIVARGLWWQWHVTVDTRPLGTPP